MLRLICWLTFGLFSTSVLARTTDYCGGKYLRAAMVLEAAYNPYGTAYSGGDFTSKRDNVGATIDLYRLLAGLEHLRFSKVDNAAIQVIDTTLPELPISQKPIVSNHWDRGPKLADMIARHGAPWFEQSLRDALTLAEAPDPDLTSDQKARIAFLLDVATSPNPRPDWWLTTDPLDLTPLRQITARVAKESDLLAWLQMMAVESARPENIVPYAQDTTFDRYFAPALLREIDRRQAVGSKPVWQAVRVLLTPLPLPHDHTGGWTPFYDELLEGWRKVQSCQPDAATYAWHVMALARPGMPFLNLSKEFPDLIPKDMQPRLLRRYVLARFLERGWRSQPLARELDKIFAQTTDPFQRAWLNVGRSFLAEDIGQFIAIHDGTSLDSRSYRLLNLLSGDDLGLFIAAPARTAQEKALLVPFHYQRLFALGRWREALDLREELAYQRPDLADMIRKIDQSRADDEVKAALIAMTLRWSVWIRGEPLDEEFNADPSIRIQSYRAYSNDLPKEIATVGFLARDFETWAMLPSRWGEYQADPEGGFNLPELSRWHFRNLSLPADPILQFFVAPEAPAKDWETLSVPLPLTRWIAHDELRQLGPSQGWKRKVSAALLTWAGDADKLYGRASINREPLMPWALVQLIDMNRDFCSENLSADSAGYVALGLLRKNFSQTAEYLSLPDYFRDEPENCAN